MPKVARKGDRGIKGVIEPLPASHNNTTDKRVTAKVGDLYLCSKHSTGSPYMIKNGCLFFKIDGKPVAMQYASKATCGCRIIEGSDIHSCCPHLDAKAKRLAEREMLIEKARDTAASGKATPEEAANLNKRADSLERLNKDVRCAEMSIAAYEPSEGDPPNVRNGLNGGPEGTVRLNGDPAFQDMVPSKLQDATWNDDKSGFHADLYYDELNGTYTVAYRGTEGHKNDIATDHNQAHGLETTQYNQGMKIGEQIKEARKDDPNLDIQTTGHSLGGGLASAGGTVGGVPYTTVNAAGVHPNTVSRYTDGKLQNANGAAQGTNYYTDHDPLSFGQTEKGSNLVYGGVKGTAGAASTLGVGGKLVGGVLNLYAGWSEAQTGGRLPPSPAEKQYELPTRKNEGGVSQAMDGVEGWAKGHSSVVALDGIESQKEADQSAIKRLLKRIDERGGQK